MDMMEVANVLKFTSKNKNEKYSGLYRSKIYLCFSIIIIIKKIT